MHLQELLSLIFASSREQWHLIVDSPSYHDHLEFFEVYNGQKNVLHVEEHRGVAVYIPDVSITMAWGLKWQKNFQADWCNQFSDPAACGGWLDVFFHNAMAYRVPYVWVNGAYFPLPQHRNNALVVSRIACDFMELITSMEHAPRPGQYESDLNTAGFKVVDEAWPTL